MRGKATTVRCLRMDRRAVGNRIPSWAAKSTEVNNIRYPFDIFKMSTIPCGLIFLLINDIVFRCTCVICYSFTWSALLHGIILWSYMYYDSNVKYFQTLSSVSH